MFPRATAVGTASDMLLMGHELFHYNVMYNGWDMLGPACSIWQAIGNQ